MRCCGRKVKASKAAASYSSFFAFISWRQSSLEGCDWQTKSAVNHKQFMYEIYWTILNSGTARFRYCFVKCWFFPASGPQSSSRNVSRIIVPSSHLKAPVQILNNIFCWVCFRGQEQPSCNFVWDVSSITYMLTVCERKFYTQLNLLDSSQLDSHLTFFDCEIQVQVPRYCFYYYLPRG